MTSTFIAKDTFPSHWELLSEDDKQGYISIKSLFNDDLSKSKRGERFEIFVTRLKTIRDYINRNPNDQWKRSLVCGMVFLTSALGINIQQLRLLMGKCKSSINGSLQQLGYTAKPSTHEIDQELGIKIPCLKNDHYELKKWTIRYGTFPDEYKQKKSEPNKIQTKAQVPNNIEKVKPLAIKEDPLPQTVNADDVIRVVNVSYPCPAKCRHKFYDLLHSSISIQTDA
ncbi:hypothetical protein TRFO_36278 [Tritrichomonas foetus]|uniref:Initiator binding domain-containing protein n=1 Tax=Tritrichomonas foetus TaxID=1144522 RepID=A0A1J4JGX5_9EUKA|nr:hypothetical protein TRFO_36278 [Tritrichomonas foetus]|eukprot:OHS97519.1 hypothetical protein TRFO_36278 [Tritrichomonas foetus]